MTTFNSEEDRSRKSSIVDENEAPLKGLSIFGQSVTGAQQNEGDSEVESEYYYDEEDDEEESAIDQKQGYEVDRSIEEGGQALIYAATHQKTRKEVIIKRYRCF